MPFDRASCTRRSLSASSALVACRPHAFAFHCCLEGPDIVLEPYGAFLESSVSCKGAAQVTFMKSQVS